MSLQPDPIPQQYPEPPAPVRAISLGVELVIPLDPELALVASRSERATWHVIDHQRCSCPAFRYRETCRHLAVARQATAIAFPPAKHDAPPVFRTGTGVDDSLTRLDAELAALAPTDAEPRFFRNGGRS